MTLVRVTVSQEQPARGRPKTFTLERWVASKSGAPAADSSSGEASFVGASERHP